MTKETAETCLPNSFKKLNERITKILRDNSEPNDINSEASYEMKKLDLFTKVFLNVQKNLMTSNNNQDEVRHMILGMKKDIGTMIDGHSSEDIEKILTQFADMSGTIHSNFSQLHSRLNDL